MLVWAPSRKFRCPQHYCTQCSQSGNSNVLCTCMVCADSCHVKCLPEDGSLMLRLTNRYGLCTHHPQAKNIPLSAMYVCTSAACVATSRPLPPSKPIYVACALRVCCFCSYQGRVKPILPGS